MRSLSSKVGFSLLFSFALCGMLIGCDGGGDGLEKPSPKANLQPDLNRMPGFNQMQDDLKKKGYKGSQTKEAPKEDTKDAPAADTPK